MINFNKRFLGPSGKLDRSKIVSLLQFSSDHGTSVKLIIIIRQLINIHVLITYTHILFGDSL